MAAATATNKGCLGGESMEARQTSQFRPESADKAPGASSRAACIRQHECALMMND
jgi:hypothetical protein